MEQKKTFGKFRLALAAVLAIAGLSAATTLAVGGITGTGSSSSTGTQSVGGGTVTKQSITDFTLSVSDGDKAESLPFLSSVIRNSNGTVNANHNVTVTLTRPDSSSTYFVQKTDNDGRLRGHITGDNLTQVGSYNLSAHVWSGKTASDTFSIREKLFKDLDDQVVTGRRQHFRNRTNDTNAFSIEDASGDSLFSVDTILKTVTTASLLPKTAGTITGGILHNAIDPRQYTGEYGADMVNGPDGLPRIAYDYYDNNDSANSALGFVRCLDADCSQKVITRVPPTIGGEAFNPSLLFGSDGFARISYLSDQDNSLHFVRCTDADCATAVDSTVDPAGTTNYSTGLAIGPDGFARIAYEVYESGYKLKYVRCLDADCATSNITVIGDSYGLSNYYTTPIIIGPDGYARLAYTDGNSYELKLAACNDADCANPTINVINDNSDNEYPGSNDVSMVKGPDGFPRITQTNSNNDVYFLRCQDADCVSFTTNKVGTSDGYYSGVSLALDSAGLPWISEEEYDTNLPRLKHCADAACSSMDQNILLSDIPYVAATNNVVAIGPDDLPRVLYGDGYQSGSSYLSMLYARLLTADGRESVNGTDIGSSDAPFGQITAAGLKVQGSRGSSLQVTGSGTTILGDYRTGSYSAGSVPFSPATLTGAATSLALSDDSTVPVVIPFNFNFYGRSYSQVYVSSNGFLTFAIDDATTTTGYLDDSDSPNAVIAGHWKDLEPADGGTIKYETQGTAPHRVFIVEYKDVPECCSDDPDVGKVTFQVKLFEGSGNVEIHTLTADDSITGNSPAAQGLEDQNGANGVYLTDREGNWPIDLTNEGLRFTYQSSLVDLGSGSLAVQNQADFGGDVSFHGKITGTVAFDGTASFGSTSHNQTAANFYSQGNAINVQTVSSGTGISVNTSSGTGIYVYSSGSDGIYVQNNSSGNAVRAAGTSGNGLWASSSNGISGLFYPTNFSTQPTLVGRQYSNSTTDIFQIQNSSSAVLAKIDYQGNLTVKGLVANGNLDFLGHLATSNLNGGTTTATKQDNAGSTGTCTVSGSDTTATVTITPGGTGINSGLQCTINFANSYAGATHAVISALDGPSQSRNVYAASYTDRIEIFFNTAGVAGTAYKFNYFNAH